MTGCKILFPNFGEISVINTAPPIANGAQIKAENSVTANDPAIIGNAPTTGFPSLSSFPRSQSFPKRKSVMLALLMTNVLNPFDVTKYKIEAATKTIKATHKSVTILPRRSIHIFDFARALFIFVHSTTLSLNSVSPFQYK